MVLFDGRGREATARVATATGGEVTLRVLARRVHPAPDEAGRCRLTLAVAMPKGPRADYLVEKSTELGVAALWPILAERSVVRPGPGRVDKWRRVAIEAARQSGQVWLPKIATPRPLENVLAPLDTFESALVASLEDAFGRAGGRPPPPLLTTLERLGSSRSLIAVIGPEGGWTTDEVHALRAHGAVPVSLGHSILRVETASLFVAAVVVAWSERVAAMGNA